VYLLGLRDGNIIFLADAEPPDSDDHSPPVKVTIPFSAAGTVPVP
jgi:hypothetical protein